ncbi:hypothetical protein R3P38DRAFT_3215418 [Favolaschia claudopus]|uniref:Uncharacterized protein n=1 Tax=Favolaschia claudopus TaxID=2862362 RepID=A0AAW0A8Q7_9AGAR
MAATHQDLSPLVFVACPEQPVTVQFVADINSMVNPRDLMGLYLYLETVGFCAPVDDSLARLNCIQLFDAALRSTGLAASNVHNFLGRHVDEPIACGQAKPVVQDALRTYHQRVFRTPVSSRVVISGYISALALTGEKNRTLEDDLLLPLLLQYSISRLLQPFGLYYGDLVLLHAATGTVVCGQLLDALLDYRVKVDCLDFYCGYGAESRVRSYLMNVAKFKLRGIKTEGNPTGVALVVGLEHRSGVKIRIFQVAMLSPVQAVFPSPAVIGTNIVLKRPAEP